MSTHLNPIVLEARFAQLAIALTPADSVPGPALHAVGEQARRALRGVEAGVDAQESARLGRAASRLARRLLVAHGAAVAPELGVLRLGREMQCHLDPLDVAATVRSVRVGRAQLPGACAPIVEPDAAQARLFTLIALVAVLTQRRRA